MNVQTSFDTPSTLHTLLLNAQPHSIQMALDCLMAPNAPLPPAAQLRKHLYQSTDAQLLEFLDQLRLYSQKHRYEHPAFEPLTDYLCHLKDPNPIAPTQIDYLSVLLPLIHLFFCDPKMYALFLDALSRQHCLSPMLEQVLWNSAYGLPLESLPHHLKASALGSSQMLIDMLSYTSLYLLTQQYPLDVDKVLAHMSLREQVLYKMHQRYALQAVELKAPVSSPTSASEGWLSIAQAPLMPTNDSQPPDSMP